MKFGKLAFAQRDKRSPEESDLVRRLDIFLMTFGCISQVIKCETFGRGFFMYELMNHFRSRSAKY
ncbi:hypothetical protein F4779DRAFT_601398 [Xylariaceae sp. FL0662B]|nr:hypothetical protein F4779DRAFT_601398 [Xylariaceae sp. FL0662B]